MNKYVTKLFSADTSIAELVKEVTDSDDFMDSLRTQQGK
jgi:hypothetical protein